MKSNLANMMGGLAFLAVGVTAGAGLSVPARAASLGLDISGVITDLGPAPTAIGWLFTANQNITVTGLGTWAGAPFPTDQTVELLGPGFVPIAIATVSNTDLLVGTGPWRFASVSPVQLTAGSSYLLYSLGGADFTVTDPAFGGTGTTTIDPRITFAIGAEGPVGLPIAYGLFGPNLEFINTPTVPVPGALPLFGSALMGVVALLRRRSKPRRTEAP